MRRQNRRILQKITAVALSAALAVGMAQGGVPGWVFAQEDIGSQGNFSAAARTNDNETWEEGSTISYRTISGGTESDPVVITVTGNVTVTGEITISGHVKFTGGGVLKWASTGSDNALEVAEGASAVFENVTLNGDENYFRYSALLFRGTVEFGEGTTIQNFYSGTTSNAVPGHKGVIAVCDKGVLNIKEGAFITGNKCESGIISLYQTDDGGSSMPITAEVNIEGGRIEGNTVNNENLGVVWNWFGNLNITGGTVTASANEYAVYTQGNESRYAGTTEIYGGTFTGEQVGAVCSGRDPGNTRSKIIIAGGVFKGKIAARVNYGTIDVRGGKYEGSQYALMSSTGQGALTVQGGEFLGGIAAYSGNITTKTQKVVVGESVDSANDWDKSTSLNNYKYVAIGDSDNAYVHTHTRIKHESTATCTESGTGEYWQCEGENGCGKLFAEDNDKTEIAQPPYKEATGCALEESVWKYDKDTHWHQCICGKNKSQAEAHTFESDSVGTQVCSVCGYMEGAGPTAIEDVENKITAIASETEYTQEWAQKVEVAQKAYNDLEEEEKAKVSAELKQDLEDAKKKYDNWMEAQEVKNQIEAIGEVTAGNASGKKEQIESAREAYDSLTEEQKKLITPEDKKKLTDAEKMYDNATGGKNQEAADAVKEKIDQIPSPVTSDQEIGKKIEDAKESYENLTGMQKDMLPEKSIKKLEEAVEDYNKLAADEVRKKIEAIGEVTPETAASKKELIEEAREWYDRLTEEQKKLITPEEKKKLTDAEKMYDNATGGKNQEAADAVKEKIDQIPSPVTSDEETGKKIEDAKESYENLTGMQKDMLPEESVKKLEEAVEDYNKLAADEVRKKIEAIGEITLENALEKKELIEAARDTYDKLTDGQKDLITSEEKKKLTDAEKMYDNAAGGKNQEAADAVKEKIDQIPSPVTLDQETGKKIEDAKESYENLTGMQKDMLPEENIKKLEEAVEDYNKLAADEVRKKIEAIGSVTPETVVSKKELIEEAREWYDRLTEEQKKLITPEEQKKLTDAEKVYDDATGGNNQEVVDAVKEKIDQIPSPVTSDQETGKKIEEAREAYDRLTEEQKKLITPEDKKKLTDAEKAYDDATGGKNQEAADAVKEKIDQIPSQITTDEETKQKLEDAKKAYEDLTTTQKDMVPEASKKKLEDAEEEYKKQEETDKQAAEEVKKKIDAIGEVTLENVSGKKEQIEEARKAYDALTEVQKKYIMPEDKKKLTDAEKTYDDATGGKNQEAADTVKEKIDQIPSQITTDEETKQKLEDAKKAYEDLTTTQKDMVPEASKKKLEDAEEEYKKQEETDKQAAEEVKKKIDAIGEVTPENVSGKKEQIEEARKTYDGLTEVQKKYITPEDKKKLTDAEKTYDDAAGGKNQAAANAVKEKIDQIPTPVTVDWDTKKKIEEARKAYDGLTGMQKDMVPEASRKKLEDAEREYRRQVSAEDESAVQNVMNKINAIGTVVNTDQCGKKIKDARAAYSMLTENQKKLFPKDILKKLTDAEAKYAKLNEKPSQNQQQIDNIADKLGVSKETAKQIQKVAEELGVEVETLLVTDKQLTASKTEADTKGSTFSKLLLKAVKVKTKSVTLKWKKVKGADGYMVYGSPCNQKPKLIKTVKKNSSSFTYKKAKKGKSYKFTVRAYKKIGGKKVTIAVSKRVHLHTAGSKYGNPKGVKVNKKKVTVKKGKTFRIKASNIKPKKRLRKHRIICYESSNKKVATVTKKGVIKGKKKGTCKVYVYAQNGVYKTITVKVK